MKTKSQSANTTRTNKTAFITGAVAVSIAIVPFVIKLFTDNGTDFVALVAALFALELFYFLVLAVIKEWKLDYQIAQELSFQSQEARQAAPRKETKKQLPVATPANIPVYRPTAVSDLQVGALKASCR